MKAPIVEKSTLKGIIIGFSICCLLSLTVFVSKAVNFEAYRINSPEKELTQEKWNSLVTTGIEKFLNKYNDEDLYKYKFPIGTVVMYAKSGGCPKGWEQWGDGLDGKFIMPLQTTDGTALMYGGSKSFTILNENLPKHSHKFIYDGKGSAGVSESTYLASNNYGNQNYGDYDLKFNSNVATVGLTSREGGDEPIEFMPKYAKVLFCIKVSEGEADDSGEDVESPQCGTKDKLTGEPTTPAEKCIIGDPSSVVLSNGVYRWTCTNGSQSESCYSSGTYTVKYDCYGGSNAPADQTFTVGSSQALHANTCTRTSYAFKGWSTIEGGAKVYDDKQSVNPGGTAGSTVVLYAVWEYSPQTYTIEFSKGWDSDVIGTMSNLECKVGVPCKLTKIQYIKNNYDFVGWSVWTTPTATPDYLDGVDVLDIASGGKTKTLYPIWKPKTPSTPSCTPRTCSYYSRASKAPSSGCYSAVDLEDGCGGNLTCYSIGCDEITRDRGYTGYKGYKCYNDINKLSPRQQVTMVVCSGKDGGYCADPTLEGGYYWIQDGYSYNGYCGSSYTTVSSCPSYVSNSGRYTCESYQQGYYCKSSTNSCWKCTYLTTEQIHNLH